MNKEIEGEFVSSTCLLSIYEYSFSAILRFSLLFSGKITQPESKSTYCVFVTSGVICYCRFSSYVMFAVVFVMFNSE